VVCLSIVTASCIGEPILLQQYVVLKNYQKQYHSDISLTKGHTVGVIEKRESGKYIVEVRHLKRSSKDIVSPESLVDIIRNEIPNSSMVDVLIETVDLNFRPYTGMFWQVTCSTKLM